MRFPLTMLPGGRRGLLLATLPVPQSPARCRGAATGRPRRPPPRRAAAGRDRPPSGGGQAFPFPVTEKTLPNGLKVYVVGFDSPGLVAYYSVVRTGSRNEVEPGKSGFAHFFEHLMFRGSRELLAREVQRRSSRRWARTRTRSPPTT